LLEGEEKRTSKEETEHNTATQRLREVQAAEAEKEWLAATSIALASATKILE
jgi:hypothetical protein